MKKVSEVFFNLLKTRRNQNQSRKSLISAFQLERTDGLWYLKNKNNQKEGKIMQYKMIVLDLDGTLTNSKKEISEPTREALIEIQEKGYKVVLASGRPTAGIFPLAEQLRMAEYGNYILAFNGARIIECKSGKNIYQKTLPASIIQSLYRDAREYQTGLITYQDDCIISATAVDPYIEIEAGINHIPIKQVNNFPDYVSFPVNKCLMTGDPDYLAQVEQKMKAKYNSLINIYRSEPFFLELMPQNIDKAHSLSRLLGSLGMTSDEMICCGDGFNDISMIEYAGLGVAMENAQDLVKDAADYITASNDADGILQVIRTFISPQKNWGCQTNPILNP